MSRKMVEMKRKKARMQFKAVEKSKELIGDDEELVIDESGEVYYQEKEKEQKSNRWIYVGFSFVIAVLIGLYTYVV